jgi:hypothetical protein
VVIMVAVSASNAARKKARDEAAALYDAQDAERRAVEIARRKRVLDHAADVAVAQAAIVELTTQIEQHRADIERSLAAMAAEGLDEQQVAEMTGRTVREVKAAVKTTATAKPTGRAKKTAPAKPGAATDAQPA